MKNTLKTNKVEKAPLRNAIFNVTNQCNCRCTYCFTKWNDDYMSFDTAKYAIEWLYHTAFPEDSEMKQKTEPDHFLSINWFGGEPLLYFDETIKPTMEWAEQKGFQIQWSISTNGTLLTPDRLKFLDHFNTGILFSIDGDQIIQDDQRPLRDGGSSFALLKDNLGLFGNYNRTNCIFRSTVTARNVNKLYDGYMTARKYGFYNYFAGLDFGDCEWNKEKYDILYDQVFRICTTMYDDFKHYQDCTNAKQLLTCIRDLYLNDENKNEYTELRCGLGTVSVGIAPNGMLYGCQEHTTYNDKKDPFYLGNMFDGPLDMNKIEALTQKYYEGFKNFQKSEECVTCPSRVGCYIANCPSVSYKVTGKIGGTYESFCVNSRVWYSMAMIIMSISKIDNNIKWVQYVKNYLFPTKN